MNTRAIILAMLLLGAGGSLLTGCGEKDIVITRYPAFFDREIQSVAVAPFFNASGVQGAGNILSDALAAQLVTNGTYTVFNRNDLAVLRNEQDLRTEMGLDNEEIASKFRQAGNVDAVLVGTVNTYAATTSVQQRQDPMPLHNPATGQVTVMYQTYQITRHEANVSVTARLIRVADGKTLFATPTPAHGNHWAQGQGRPAPLDQMGCLNQAVIKSVNQLVQTFAVTRATIRVKESEDFRTASELYDNEWTWSDDFKTSDTKAFIVLRLPAICNRNRFRLTIVRKGQRKDLLEKTIVWDSQYNSFGFPFHPGEVAELGGGPGEYECKFYAGPEPAMRHTFRIRD